MVRVTESSSKGFSVASKVVGSVLGDSMCDVFLRLFLRSVFRVFLIRFNHDFTLLMMLTDYGKTCSLAMSF